MFRWFEVSPVDFHQQGKAMVVRDLRQKLSVTNASLQLSTVRPDRNQYRHAKI